MHGLAAVAAKEGSPACSERRRAECGVKNSNKVNRGSGERLLNLLLHLNKKWTQRVFEDELKKIMYRWFVGSHQPYTGEILQVGEKDTPFGLFSSSGKKPSPKGQTPGRPPAPVPAAKPEPKFDRQTQEVFDQIKRMQDVLLSKLDYITRKSGMSKEEVSKMVQGAMGSKSEVDKMNADLKALTEKVWGALGEGVMPKTAPSIKGTETEKDRKGKTLGSRRRWLRMP